MWMSAFYFGGDGGGDTVYVNRPVSHVNVVADKKGLSVSVNKSITLTVRKRVNLTAENSNIVTLFRK